MHYARDCNLFKTIILFIYIRIVKTNLGNLSLNYLKSKFPAQPHTNI